MDIVHNITAVIEPSLEAMGYTLVQLKLSEGSGRKTLSVMAERADGGGMGIEDCTEISRTVSALLDVEDPIQTAYDLEVCSPGMDRPLTKPADFERYAGYEVKVETMIPMEGRKRFRGMLEGLDGKAIVMKVDGQNVKIELSNVRAAKLVLTDALVAAAMKKK